jgi:transposase
MKKRDGRKLKTEAQQEIRYIAIKLRKKGRSLVSVADTLGVSPSSVRKWWILYKEKGYKAITIRKRGVKPWVNCSLSCKQFKSLGKMIVESTPDQLGLAYDLWTRQAIQLLITKTWRINVSLVTVGRYMKQLGFTPQKPVKRAYKQNLAAVNKWLKTDYPRIVEKALQENAEINWLDETRLSTRSNYLRGYSPRGETPVIHMKTEHLSLNVITAISKLGKMRFMTYDNPLDTKTLIKFVNRLCNGTKKIFLILDNLAVHHSKKFVEWVKKNNLLEVFYLPPYSPELNPDERLNRDLKTHFHSGTITKNKKSFKKRTVSSLRCIQRSPYRVFNYFKSKDVKYAA